MEIIKHFFIVKFSSGAVPLRRHSRSQIQFGNDYIVSDAKIALSDQNHFIHILKITGLDPIVVNTIPIRSGWLIHLSKISFFVLLKPLSVTMR